MARMNRLWLLSLPLALALAGCGGGSSSRAFSPNLTYGVDLTSQDTNLKSLNGGTRTAGWNHLTGASTLGGAPIDVEMLANVSYVNGSGPFFGFLHITRGDGSILTMQMNGQAVKNAATGDTTFSADLDVVGGTDTYNNATGHGRFTGSRSAALGGPVHIDVEAEVK
jgi:hypothetical protein